MTELSTHKINQILDKEISLDEITDQELLEFCILANQRYRSGNPLISDEDYDFIYTKELKRRNPDHDFLNKVEPEDSTFSEEKVLLPQQMLSIDKAYTFEEVLKWLDRIVKACHEIDYETLSLNFCATPKLDGFAGYDDGISLYTRGDGKKGSDITRVFDRGLKVLNNSPRGQGPGEIVVKKSYFEQKLASFFEFPRNFQASLIKEKH